MSAKGFPASAAPGDAAADWQILGPVRSGATACFAALVTVGPSSYCIIAGRCLKPFGPHDLGFWAATPEAMRHVSIPLLGSATRGSHLGSANIQTPRSAFRVPRIAVKRNLDGGDARVVDLRGLRENSVALTRRVYRLEIGAAVFLQDGEPFTTATIATTANLKPNRTWDDLDRLRDSSMLHAIEDPGSQSAYLKAEPHPFWRFCYDTALLYGWQPQ